MNDLIERIKNELPATTQLKDITLKAIVHIVEHDKSRNDAINPMETAPKDGTPVLLKFKDDLSEYNKSEVWENMLFVGRNNDMVMEWGFAAPVGMGGFPDVWFQGWYDLSAIEKLKESEK